MTTLYHSVPINATPDKVFAAIASEEGNRGWWTADSKVGKTEGSKAQFGFDKREAMFHMTIDALEPGRAVVMSCSGGHPEWEGTTLVWKIDATPDGSVLSFTHKGWKRATPFCASCNSMWGRLMFRIKAYVETGKADPQWRE